VGNHRTANGLDPKALASSGQLWRSNVLGLLELREKPGQPIPRGVTTELLAMAAGEGCGRLARGW
jgi:hypothetical protein